MNLKKVGIITLLLLTGALAWALPCLAGPVSSQGLELESFKLTLSKGGVLGGQMRVEFILKNTSNKSVTFDGEFGVFAAARWTMGSCRPVNRDFGHQYKDWKLAPGQKLRFKADQILDMPGEWTIWPDYISNGKWGGFRPSAKKLKVASGFENAAKDSTASAGPGVSQTGPMAATSQGTSGGTLARGKIPASANGQSKTQSYAFSSPPPDRSLKIRSGKRVPAIIPGIYSPGGGGGGATIVMHRGRKLPLQVFPPDNPWNQDISKLPVHPMSNTWTSNIGRGTSLHADFGSGLSWKVLGVPLKKGAAFGIPFVVVRGGQRMVPMRFRTWGESDPGPYPIPANAPIEPSGDRHVIVLDYDAKRLYEVFHAQKTAWGWQGGSGAVFDLTSNLLRPLGWTSADAAGLPIFPGLARYEEIYIQKNIPHALRFTASKTNKAYILPGTHYASRIKSDLRPPMGMRVRLKAGYDISGFPEPVKIILRCLKKYGMILADNGGDWFLSGAPHPKWDDDDLKALQRVKGRDMEVVYTGEMIKAR